MGILKSYKDLEIYQISRKLAVQIHAMSLQLPNFEKYEEGSQIRRSSKSVVHHIVEGYGRRAYKNDYLRFLTVAHTECDETVVALDLLFSTDSLKDRELFNQLYSEYESLSVKIGRFRQSIARNHPGKK